MTPDTGGRTSAAAADRFGLVGQTHRLPQPHTIDDYQQLIDELTGGEPSTVEDVLQAVAARRGRPIVRCAKPLGNTMACGFVVALKDVDLLYHSQGVTPMHGDHISAHELGHLVLGHDDPDGDNTGHHRALHEELLQKLLPDIHPQAVRAIFGRTTYTQEAERAAETFATVLMARCSTPTAVFQRDYHLAERDPLESLFDPPTRPRRPRRRGTPHP